MIPDAQRKIWPIFEKNRFLYQVGGRAGRSTRIREALQEDRFVDGVGRDSHPQHRKKYKAHSFCHHFSPDIRKCYDSHELRPHPPSARCAIPPDPLQDAQGLFSLASTKYRLFFENCNLFLYLEGIASARRFAVSESLKPALYPPFRLWNIGSRLGITPDAPPALAHLEEGPWLALRAEVNKSLVPVPCISQGV